MLPKCFISRHWCKVWSCENYPVRVSPWHQKFFQNLCTMREILFIIFLISLIPCRLHNPEPHHNPRLPVCRTLYLRPILRIPYHCHIYQQPQMDPMTTLSLPPWYGLISTYEIRRREEMCEILIKMSNEVFNKFQPMILMACTLTS